MRREFFIYGPIGGCLQVRDEGSSSLTFTNSGDGRAIATKLRGFCSSCADCNGPKYITGDGTLMVEPRSPVPARKCKLKGKHFSV